MKKLLSAALALVLCLSLSWTAGARPDPVAQEALKVGMVYIGGVEDMGYTYAHHQGALAMAENLGLAQDQLLWEANVPEDEGCAAALEALVQEGCQLIFATSFGFMDYVEQAAAQYPHVVFSHCSGYKSNETNFNNYFGRIWEARYLAGIAAGLKAKEMGNPRLGYVAAYSDIPEVIYSINAYLLGVRSVYPEATLTVQAVNSWYDPQGERQAAEALIALGCGVLTHDTDSAETVNACQEQGLYAVGYNADMSSAAPGAYLTAPVWDWSGYLTRTARQVIDGVWEPVNYLGGMADGLVGLAPLTDNCTPGTQEEIQKAQTGILEGSLAVFQGPLYDNGGHLRVEQGHTLTDQEILSMSWLCQGVVLNEP